MIPKIKNAVDLDDHRGVSLLSVMSKWYMAGLVRLAKIDISRRRYPEWSRVCCFGFEAEHS
eukprot:5284143-Karenia_brevis.AAC.1